ncbi:MAG: PDZ domain-containing protein, partial [Proteobacteria bacterium]|nr:PDZ domain-containing protein [Pseudomonadota bacterium]
FRIWRRGKIRNVRFPVEAPPEIPKKGTTELSGAHPLQGATVANLSPALADEIGVDILKTGVVITEIRRASPAHRLNFRPGDIVRGVNGSEIGSVQELQRVLVSQVSRWRLAVEREGNVHSVVINR